ncbi:MAG: ABC transporter substrate-binding protein [Lachnospiraceae bacterium]|nr:ABC transporter substrate-binding protein [Lachnospiraceae bacterium]
MKKFKKVMALSLALAMGLSLVACGGGDDDATTAEGTTAGGDDAQTPATEEVQEVEMPSEDGDPIYVYSWNTELGDRLQYFRDAYPQYSDRVEYVNLGLGGTDIEYQTQIDTLLQAGAGAEKYPSIIAADNDVALHWTESEYTIPMADIGIGGDDFSEMYQYTLDYATYNGAVKAVSWQATPGVFCYRTDIAEEVLGASDPDTVQAALADWDKFFETADKLKEAGYKIVSGPDDVKYPIADSRKSPWVENDKLNIDGWVTEYLETAKKLYDGDYTNKTQMWSDAWTANMDKDVFGYFGCTWFLYWSLNPEEHANDYNICQGPVSYHWGGTYLSVGKDCPDTALAALVLRTLCCDTEVLTKLCEETKDFVNNKAAVKAVSDAGNGNSDKCGGNDPIPTFMEAAEGIDLSNATSYDAIFNGFVDTASAAYNSGEAKDVDAAIQMVKDSVSDGYNYITVE